MDRTMYITEDIVSKLFMECLNSYSFVEDVWGDGTAEDLRADMAVIEGMQTMAKAVIDAINGVEKGAEK